MTSPFAALGLPERADLRDDEVRAAWRRVAAATHPDRDDGGNPAAFAAAASAYTLLRTAAGRAEALADNRPVQSARKAAHRPGGEAWPAARTVVRLVPRLVLAAAAVALAVAGTGWQPATFGILTGALTWLLLAR
jgi:curved DNA-binding protein CbpA